MWGHLCHHMGATPGTRTDHSGNYQCKATNTDKSDPVKLDVSHDWVILQAPLYVYEGDDVTLICHHYPGYEGEQTIVYENNVVIRKWGNKHSLQIKDINVERSGVYKCTKVVYHDGGKYQHSGKAFISVQEFFITPELKVSPFPVIEGDNVTVRCHTRVSQYKPQTELQFAFYKDGRNVQGSGPSNQYGFQWARLPNSGKYYCDVKTVFGRPRVKKSKELIIEINESFTQPEIKMTPNEMAEGDIMTLTCHTRRGQLFPGTGLQFAFFRDGENVQEFNIMDQYTIGYAQSKHSGNYSCKVRASINNLIKISKEVYIQIQEIFSHPKIEMIPEVVIEGNQMVLICNTSVTRNDIELQFTFYKNGENIQEFNSSHQYEVRSAQMADSGNYSCEVTSSTNIVIKRSEEFLVGIQGNFLIGDNALTIILPLALGLILLLVVVLVILFICRKRYSPVKTQELSTERPTDYNVQPEITYSIIAMKPMSQNAPEGTEENHDNNIVYSVVKTKSKRQPAADPDDIYQSM